MAELNCQMHVKTATDYDDIYLTSKSQLVEYDNTTSGLSATDTKGAIDELARPTFTEATTLANIVSGESNTTLWGKVKKFFNFIGTTTLTTTAQTVTTAINELDTRNDDLHSQVNALVVGSGTSSAEVVQARVDSYGSVFTTVKSHFDNVEKMIVGETREIKFNDWVVGTISTSTGVDGVSTTRIRSGYYNFQNKTIISVTSGYKYYLLKYSYSESVYTFISSKYWSTTNTIIDDSGVFYYRLILADNVDSTATTNFANYIFINTTITNPTKNEVINARLGFNTLADLSINTSNTANKVYKNEGQVETIIEKYSLLNGTETGMPNTARFVSMIMIKKNFYLRSIKLKTTKANASVLVEIWSIGDTNITRSHDKTIILPVAGENTIDLDMFVDAESYISIYSANSSVANITNTSNVTYLLRTVNYSLNTTIIPLTAISEAVPYDVCFDLYGYNYNLAFTSNPSSVITVGSSGCDYTNIQDAIDNCNDSVVNPITILIYPGTYSRFSMIQTKAYINEISGAHLNKNSVARNISLIGINKHDCIIKDDSGEYYTPPAEIRTNGLIKNLTFIATHDNPPAIKENAKHKSYAIHLDYGVENLTIEDCICISYQAPAIGIGLHQGETIKLKNCDLYSYAPVFDGIDHVTDYETNYSYLTNYGAVFCHSASADNVSVQNFIMDNCRLISQDGDKGLWLSVAGNFVNCEMDVTSYNTMAYSRKIGGVKVSRDNRITITGDSFGNNDSLLNV